MADIPAPAGAKPSPAVLNSLQYLRGAAALMVTVYHLEPRLQALGWTGPWPDWPSAGVDIFFVLSGFLMWATTAGRRVTPAGFALRRIERIVPLYWIVTGVTLAVLLAAPALISSSRPDLGEALASFLFWPLRNPASGLVVPLVPQGWTLNLEMGFYAVFALCLILPGRLRLGAMTGVLVMAALAGAVVRGGPDAFVFYTDNIVLEFGLGVLLGAFWSSGLGGSKPLGLAAIGAGALAIALSDRLDPGLWRALKWGAPAGLIVGGCLLVERARPVAAWRAPRMLGDASYSLYLSHGMALTALAVVWRRAGLLRLPLSEFWFCLAGLALAVASGCALYSAVEKPIEQALKRRRGMPGPVIRPGPEETKNEAL